MNFIKKLDLNNYEDKQLLRNTFKLIDAVKSIPEGDKLYKKHSKSLKKYLKFLPPSEGLLIDSNMEISSLNHLG